MEQQPISNNFRILLLILTIPQAIAVGIAVLFAWLPLGAKIGYSTYLGDQLLPPITRFLIGFSEKIEPAKSFSEEIAFGIGFLHLSIFVALIWGSLDFSKLISHWCIATVTIWGAISAWLAILGSFLVLPFIPIYLGMNMATGPAGPRPILSLAQITSLSLLGWIIFLAISITFFLRKKARSTNQ